jgi:branched-chain amino acid transport system substrate-binding protein
MTRKILIYTLTALLFFLFVSCGKKEEDVIKIGAILSLTGNGAEYGKDQQNSINLFLERINLNTKNKFRYKVLFQDSKSTPKDAINALNNLLSTNKPDIIMTVLSSVCLSLKPITEKEKIPLFCVGANPKITLNSKYVFRSLPTSDYQAEILGKEFINKININTYSILYLNDDFGNGAFKSFKNILVSNKKKLINAVSLEPNKNDYKIEVLNAIKDNPEAIYIASFGESIAFILRNLREYGFEGHILSTLEISYPNVLSLAKNTAENVYYVDTKFDLIKINRGTSNFINEYKMRFNSEPSLDAVSAYDEFQVIFHTCENYGKSPDSFLKIKGKGITYKSENGTFTISNDGDFLYPLVLKKISNGQSLLINE